MYKLYGKTSVSEFLGDRIVYRNLQAADPSLPRLESLQREAGLAPGTIPRKTDPEYARVILRLLQHARQQDAPHTPLRKIVFLGDTRLLDGTAFANLCAASGWPGLAFIGSENSLPPAHELAPAAAGGRLYLANRWALLSEFDRCCSEQGLEVDAGSAVVIDLDKTTLGARGRNAAAIDRARIQAVEETVAEALGAAFARPAFLEAYDLLNQPEFHPFTADNQDYLAYICLVITAGVRTLESVVTGVRSGGLSSFHQFLQEVDRQVSSLPASLTGVHAEIIACVQAGDPTPFKSFRRNEYRITVGSMGCLPDDAPLERLLADEIVLTQEVRAWAQAWQQRGALLFGLSDKPDEASLPTPELAAQGCRPIHRTPAHAVGSLEI